jgi:hypothetical protein
VLQDCLPPVLRTAWFKTAAARFERTDALAVKANQGQQNALSDSHVLTCAPSLLSQQN